jgi:hypothetical protein
MIAGTMTGLGSAEYMPGELCDRVYVQHFAAEAASVGAALCHTADRVRDWVLSCWQIRLPYWFPNSLPTHGIQSREVNRRRAPSHPTSGIGSLCDLPALIGTSSLRCGAAATGRRFGTPRFSQRNTVAAFVWRRSAARGGILSPVHRWESGLVRFTLKESPFLPATISPLLPRRSPEEEFLPQPSHPVEMTGDPALLRRVLDRIRALDNWHVPSELARPKVDGP